MEAECLYNKLWSAEYNSRISFIPENSNNNQPFTGVNGVYVPLYVTWQT